MRLGCTARSCSTAGPRWSTPSTRDRRQAEFSSWRRSCAHMGEDLIAAEHHRGRWTDVARHSAWTCSTPNWRKLGVRTGAERHGQAPLRGERRAISFFEQGGPADRSRCSASADSPALLRRQQPARGRALAQHVRTSIVVRARKATSVHCASRERRSGTPAESSAGHCARPKPRAPASRTRLCSRTARSHLARAGHCIEVISATSTACSMPCKASRACPRTRASER